MNLDWNHFRYLLELERCGSVRAAAEHLGLHHATISRHIAAVQEHLGARLVERDGRRFVFTEAGREFLEAARDIESRVMVVRRTLRGRDTTPSGRVRITLPESVFDTLAPHLSELNEQYPNISIDLITGHSFRNLARLEADVAVRITTTPPDTLIGKRIAHVTMHAYGTAALLDNIEPCDVADYPWIGWAETFSHFPMETWLRSVVPRERVRFTVERTAALLKLARCGVGVAVLPHFVVANEPSLRRASCPSIPTFHNDVWVLTHKDLRSVPRVKAVMKWLGERCVALLHTGARQ